MKVEMISKTVGVNSYEDLSAGQIIAAVARHGTIKDDNGKLVRYLIDHKHWSPLMSVNYGFKIETRRSISAQLFRHDSLDKQEWSLRYSEPLGFEKIELRKEHPTNRQSSTDPFNPLVAYDTRFGLIEESAEDAIDNLMEQIEELYQALLSAGVAKECARDILPMCTKTIIHLSGNLRDWLAFLNVRCDRHTQKEAREIALLIGEALENDQPQLFSAIDWREGMFM